MRCYVQRGQRVLPPSALRRAGSSAKPAHLRREMTGAEQVSQPWQNNILCLLQRQCFCISHWLRKSNYEPHNPSTSEASPATDRTRHNLGGSHVWPECTHLTLLNLPQCQPARASTQHHNKSLIAELFATCFKTGTGSVFRLIPLEIYCIGTKRNTDHVGKKIYVQRQYKIYYSIIYVMQDPKAQQPGLTRQN